MAPDLELAEEIWKPKLKVPRTVHAVIVMQTAGGGGPCCLGGSGSPPGGGDEADWKGQWVHTLAFDLYNNSVSGVLFLTPFHGQETEAHRSWVLAQVHKPHHRKNPHNPASSSASVTVYSLSSQNIQTLSAVVLWRLDDNGLRDH